MANSLDSKTQEALNKILLDDSGAISPEMGSLFEECLKAFEYKGFDPERIRKVLAIRQSRLRDGTAIDLGSDRTIPISGTTGLNNLVSFLLTLFNLRGNNLDSIKDGLEGRTKTSFDAMVASLDLKSKVVTQSRVKSSETLTLSRISAAFPLHSLSVVRHTKFDRKIIDLSDIGAADSELARCFEHPVCASTMPAHMIESGCHAITFLASLRLNAVIGQSQKTSPDGLWSYHLAILASKAVPETRKQAYWSKLYSADIVQGWVEEAKKILKKDLPNGLYTSVIQYRKP
nr:MAG: nucleoprotein [Anopheles bunyavirus 1]